MTITALVRRLFAACLLALCLVGGAFAADAPASETAEPPIRVVIMEQLLEAPPVGLAVLSNAVAQLELEFRPRSTEIVALGQQYEAAQLAAQQAEQAGQKDQAAIDRAEQLGRDLDRKREDGGAAYTRRQAEVFNPLVQQVDLALQRYGSLSIGGDVFLVSWEDFNAQPAGQLTDVTAEFVAWMKTQP